MKNGSIFQGAATAVVTPLTANGVDYFIANSKFIARRIKKVYGREAEVIYPPVDVEAYQMCEQKEDFYLTASRMVPYKKIKLIVCIKSFVSKHIGTRVV